MKPLISVVIPNFNGEKTVGNTIESIYEQKTKRLEIIVVDDMSTDDSVDMIKKRFPKVKIAECNDKKYAAGARNIGIAHASGEYVLFVDNDAYLGRGCMKSMLKEAGKYDIIYPKVVFENNVMFHPRTKDQRKYITTSACFMIKSSSLKKLHEKFGEFFDETYQIYWEDTEFFLRCRLCGLSAKYAPDARVIHVLKSSSFRSRELFFFLCVRNAIYSFIKYSCIKKLNFINTGHYGFIGLKNILRYLSNMLLINMLLNYSGLDRFSSRVRNNSLKNKIYLIFNHEKITNKTQLYLLYLFFKAVLWNIRNMDASLKKKYILGRSLNKYASQAIQH